MQQLFFLLILISGAFAASLEPNATHLRVKTANLNGNLGFKVAEFGLEFEEPIYFQFPAPCPAGRCSSQRTPEYIAANPCEYLPCDFTLKGDDCGRARLPQCETYCSELRPKLCPPIQNWIVLELGLESEPIYLSNREPDIFLRVNFDQPCKALVFQVITIYGASVIMPIDIKQYDPIADNNCVFVSPPEGITAVCPSFTQCYHYGTYFMRLKCFESDALATVRIFALDIEEGPQRTTSPLDSPPVVIPDPMVPSHVPLQWSVPFIYTFEGNNAFIPLILSTYYCGFVTLQVNLESFDPIIVRESIIVFVSLDLTNPFPVSITSDMVFLTLPWTKIYICQDDISGEPARMFLTIIRSNGAFLGTSGTISITVDYNRSGLIPINPPQKAGDVGSWSNYTSWPSANWYGFSLGALQINCPGFSKFDCSTGCEKFGCCQNTWPAYPTGSSLQPLYPVPYPLRFRNEGVISTDFLYFPKYLSPYFMGTILLLEESFSGSIEYGPLGSNWEEILPTCTISTGKSPMGTLDGRWIQNIYQPLYVERKECDYAQFTEISSDLDYIFELFVEDETDDVGTNRPLSLRYRADIMTTLDSWIDCQAFVKNDLLNEAFLNLTALNTKSCPVYSDDDPCCNPNLAWNECCIPRSLEFELEFASEIIENFNETCTLASCSLPILQSYIQGTLTETTGACEPASLASPSEVTTQTITFFTDCFEKYFGQDFKGLTCYEDSQCPDVGRCDLISHRCMGDAFDLTKLFVQCVIDNISTPVLLSFIEDQEWVDLLEEGSNLTEIILEYYIDIYCVHKNYPIFGTLYGPHFRTFTPFPGCPQGDHYSLTRMSIPPLWAAARQATGGNCAYDYSMFVPNVDREFCESVDWICPFDVCDDSFVCVVCETTSSCKETNLPLCDGQVCLLANGDIVTGLTEEQCSLTYSCTNSMYSTQNQCVQNGICQDNEEVYYLIDNTPWAGTHSRLGVCAFPMPPYDIPDCNILYTGSFPSSYGCLRFGRCQISGFGLTCNVDYDTEISCSTSGGTWYPKPETKIQCENPTLCDVARYTGHRSVIWESNYHYLSAFPSVENCESCDGEVRSVNTWIPHQWLGGKSYIVETVQRSPVQQYAFRSSINFAAFSEAIIIASETTTGFQTLNALQCTYGNQKSQISRLACDCLGFDSCFEQNSVASIGQGRFCPFTQNRIASPPFTIESSNSTLSSSVKYQCIDFQIGKIASQTFDPPPVRTVTIAFKRRNKFNFVPGSYATVFNSNEALVGSVVGDGIQISFSSSLDAGATSEILLCETLAPYIVPDFSKYPIYDFGEVDFSGGQIAVHPLHLKTTYYPSSNEICALLVLSGKETVKYAPIVRMENDEDVDGVALRDGEKACLYVVASLFVIACIIWLIFGIEMTFKEVILLSRPANVVWICSIWIFVQRAIYLYLIAADVLGHPNENQLADYFMMDFPICLYLIANYQIGLSFIFLHIKTEEDRKQYWLYFGLGAFLIIMLFIGVLLAYRYEVLDQPGVSGPLLCPIYSDTSNVARIIRLIYQSIIIFVSLCIGLTEFFLGSSLYKKMSGITGSSRVLILGITASFGIIADAIAFLIYYIVDDPSPYFSIVLIFTEIIPLVFLTFQLKTSALKHGGSLSSHSPSGVSSGKRSA